MKESSGLQALRSARPQRAPGVRLAERRHPGPPLRGGCRSRGGPRGPARRSPESSVRTDPPRPRARTGAALGGRLLRFRQARRGRTRAASGVGDAGRAGRRPATRTPGRSPERTRARAARTPGRGRPSAARSTGSLGDPNAHEEVILPARDGVRFATLVAVGSVRNPGRAYPAASGDGSSSTAPIAADRVLQPRRSPRGNDYDATLPGARDMRRESSEDGARDG